MYFMHLFFSLLIVLNCAAVAVYAHTDDGEAAIEEVVVVGVKGRLAQKGTLKDAIEMTEQIGAGDIAAARAVSLTEAMQDAPGVIVANECSMCGYKRIQLNGLKAEHTTILTDGLPTHTMLSGFYAVDAIAMTGVDRIDVARGAGASMTAPEAIGGVVNIITTESTQNGFKVDAGMGEEGFKQLGLRATLANEPGSARLTLIGQFDERDQFDADDNGVNENPFLSNTVVAARLSWDVSLRDNLALRIGRSEQEVFGGPILGSNTRSIGAAIASERNGEASQLFVNDDVRNRYIGEPWETTEWVDTSRNEYTLSWLREISDTWNMTLSYSRSEHEQDSYYEGFDYLADDDMSFLEAKFNWRFHPDHLLTFGTDQRFEEMRSFSEAGVSANSDGNPDTAYVSDSFDYDVRGVYVQDSWRVNERLEIKAALRFDRVVANFVDPNKPGDEIDEGIISPRIDARYTHNDRFTSRVSAGRGYRAPLSFFETDHGILDASLGFEIDVDELERSISASYALTFEGDRLSATGSISRTRIEHLATLEETVTGVPLLTQLDSDADITSMDLTAGFAVTDHLNLGLTIARYFHDDEFQSSFGVATTEQQVSMSADWDRDGWELYGSLSWVGSRDLSDYGYEGYNDAALTLPKTLNAPSILWLDVRAARTFENGLTVYLGANNLLDATQAEDDDSPLFFDADGGYDVAYIYGLLRGREVYAGVQFEF